jgi:hypothetical protein
VAWLYTVASSATGTMTVGQSAQAAGDFTPPAQTNFVAGNAYTASRLFSATLGQGFVTRAFPLVPEEAPNVVFYRLSLNQEDNNATANIESLTVGTLGQEIEFKFSLDLTASCSWQNCFFNDVTVQVVGASAFAAFLYGGGLYGSVSGFLSSQGSASFIVDADFAIVGATPLNVSSNSESFLGNAGIWMATGGPSGGFAIEVNSAELQAGLTESDTAAVCYGLDQGTPITVNGYAGALSMGGSMVNVFKFSHSTFEVGNTGQGFGFNTTTGAYVGPTSYTFAHFDAVLGAGTGLGGSAPDPTTMCSVTNRIITP